MSKNTKDILIIVGISLILILVITVFLTYRSKGKKEVMPASGNSISNDKIETQENVLTETEQENIEKEAEEKEAEEKEDEKTEENEKEEVVNKKPNNTNKDTVTNTNKDTATNTNKDNNNSSNNQTSTSEETTNRVNKLSQPQNIKWSEIEIGLVTWSPVKEADGYFTEVFKDGTSIGAGGGLEPGCNIKELIRIHGAGTYTVKIKAQSNVLPSSDVVTTYTAKKLSKPENIKWSESKIGLVTWSPVQYADEYSVEIFKDGTSIGAGGSPETSCEIETLIKQHGAGTYTVKVKAHSNILPSSEEVTTTYTVNN